MSVATQQQQQVQSRSSGAPRGGWNGGTAADGDAIYRLPPFYYMHVLDLNTNVTRVEIGPKTYVRQDNERAVLPPTPMVIVPPRHYCIIENPIVPGLQVDSSGQVQLSHADHEIRLAQPPFPLYPGEILKLEPTKLQVVLSDSALHLKAILDFEDDDKKTKRVAGDEWLFEGPGKYSIIDHLKADNPGTYIPRKEVIVEKTIAATIIRPNEALKLRARRETIDRDGSMRVTGEEWLVHKIGAYLPGAYEEVVGIVRAHVLTDKKALHVRANRTFKDQFGIVRKNGEEWLIRMSDSETYISGVYEEVVDVIRITTLSNRQYAIILNPIGDDGKPMFGKRKLVQGEQSFFLQPGESFEHGIQDVFVLGENEGLILKCIDAFKDTQSNVDRTPGDKWMIRGCIDYVPPVEVEVVARRMALPLDENEGIYVRDVKTGRVRAIIGETYMLTQDEELWEKDLPETVEQLLGSNRDPLADRGFQSMNVAAPITMTLPKAPRDRTRVVTLRVPHNSAVQIYDYKEKRARVVFGPELVMLGPDEHFTQLSLSGGKPKRPNTIRSLCLLLGPDFCTDVVTVETSDHARLQLQLSYNWHFDVGDRSQSTGAKLFSVPDFVGDACKAIASRVRGMVAQVPFDEFHKNSARIIRAAVFGIDENQKIRDRFLFAQNQLVVTSTDIQSVEPVDQRTRDSLQKSVQLAIEITTNSQEATARHEAERLEQEARGRLERQKITDQAAAERSRRDLLDLQAQSAAVESTGQAKAEAMSSAESARIEGRTAVEQAELKAEASKIEIESEMNRLKARRDAELKYLTEKYELELHKAKQMAEIEIGRFKETVASLGADTIRAIATAGPELQVKLLQGLGLHTTLITDGASPINLFQTAQGLIGGFDNSHRSAKTTNKKQTMMSTDSDHDDDDRDALDE